MAQGSPELLKMLAEIDPRQPYGTPLFDALARLMPIVGMEGVCIREGKDGLEVFLTVREANEVYAGEGHAPGSIVRLKEALEANVFSRLVNREFKCSVRIRGFCGIVNNKQEMRGHAISIVFVCELEGEPPTGEWHPVHNLPKNMVNVHRDAIIPMAAEAWRTGAFCPFVEY